MIPVLPAAEVRAAMAADDWERATALLREHDDQVMAMLSTIDLDTAPREPWMALLNAQRALAEELRIARDQAASALAKLDQDQRGARAWHKALA